VRGRLDRLVDKGESSVGSTTTGALDEGAQLAHGIHSAQGDPMCVDEDVLGQTLASKHAEAHRTN